LQRRDAALQPVDARPVVQRHAALLLRRGARRAVAALQHGARRHVAHVVAAAPRHDVAGVQLQRLLQRDQAAAAAAAAGASCRRHSATQHHAAARRPACCQPAAPHLQLDACGAVKRGKLVRKHIDVLQRAVRQQRRLAQRHVRAALAARQLRGHCRRRRLLSLLLGALAAARLRHRQLECSQALGQA
jgi:hypothetical protein